VTANERPSAEPNRTDADQIARLMGSLRLGSKEAAGQLVAIFYPELRRMARSCMRNERTPHTWQPTVLVNELYLELIKIKALNEAEEHRSDREAFLGLAAHIMRRMLIHHARPLYRHAEAIDFGEELDLKTLGAADLAAIEDLLARLAKIDPDLRTIVEMHVFEGFTIAEIASHLNCASRTVDRRWSFARKWLEHQLAAESDEEPSV
jgi:RNA polymerase sigma factor (TIGR02999 family)